MTARRRVSAPCKLLTPSAIELGVPTQVMVRQWVR